MSRPDGPDTPSPYWSDSAGREQGPGEERAGDAGEDAGQAPGEGADDSPRARRRRRAAAIQARRVRRRAWMRDLARALLIGALVTLAVLAVEIGRKAIVVIHRADRASLTDTG